MSHISFKETCLAYQNLRFSFSPGFVQLLRFNTLNSIFHRFTLLLCHTLSNFNKCISAISNFYPDWLSRFLMRFSFSATSHLVQSDTFSDWRLQSINTMFEMCEKSLVAKVSSSWMASKIPCQSCFCFSSLERYLQRFAVTPKTAKIHL